MYTQLSGCEWQASMCTHMCAAQLAQVDCACVYMCVHARLLLRQIEMHAGPLFRQPGSSPPRWLAHQGWGLLI